MKWPNLVMYSVEPYGISILSLILSKYFINEKLKMKGNNVAVISKNISFLMFFKFLNSFNKKTKEIEPEKKEKY